MFYPCTDLTHHKGDPPVPANLLQDRAPAEGTALSPGPGARSAPRLPLPHSTQASSSCQLRAGVCWQRGRGWREALGMEGGSGAPAEPPWPQGAAAEDLLQRAALMDRLRGLQPGPANKHQFRGSWPLPHAGHQHGVSCKGSGTLCGVCPVCQALCARLPGLCALPARCQPAPSRPQVTQYLLDQSCVMDEESLYEASLRIEPKLPS